MLMLGEIFLRGSDSVDHPETKARILVNGDVHADLFLLGKQGIDEFKTVEDLQLLDFLAYADIFDGYLVPNIPNGKAILSTTWNWTS